MLFARKPSREASKEPCSTITGGIQPLPKENLRKTGSQMEEAAVSYLAERGVTILERNFRSRTAEIDIIGKQNGTIQKGSTLTGPVYDLMWSPSQCAGRPQQAQKRPQQCRKKLLQRSRRPKRRTNQHKKKRNLRSAGFRTPSTTSPTVPESPIGGSGKPRGASRTTVVSLPARATQQ